MRPIRDMPAALGKSEHVPPAAAIHDVTNVLSADAERLGDDGMRYAGKHAVPDFAHLIVRELGERTSLSATIGVSRREGASLPPLISGVTCVIAPGSEKEVIGVAATPVVAPVKHAQAGRDWSSVMLPRQTMRVVVFPGPPVNPDSPVSGTTHGTSKRPAHIWAAASINLLPEPLKHGAIL